MNTVSTQHSAVLLQAFDLACVRGERVLFGSLHAVLRAGEALLVAGPNGSGKTSLLRALCGLSSPARGSVSRGAATVYLGHASGLKDELDAVENLCAGAALAGAPVARGAALAALADNGLAQLARLPVGALSQGQRKRVALTRLRLAPAGAVWILDEPFSALDSAGVERLRDLLDEHLAAGGAVVYTTHQPVALAAWRTQRIDLGHAPC
ncbi:MAG: heme ABC exporter ATP-binding protein CcmA [Pseudomonadota bacterium]